MSDPIAPLFDRIADGDAELARVLRPGGQLLLSSPGPCPADDWWVYHGESVDEFTARPGTAPDPRWMHSSTSTRTRPPSLFSESGGAGFRSRVLDSLHDHHPAHGERLIAGAVFERLERS